MTITALVYGIAISGDAVAQALHDRGIRVLVADDAPTDSKVADAAAVGAELIASPDAATLDNLGLHRRREILEQITIKVEEHISTYGTIDGNIWSRANKIDVFDASATLAAARTAAEHLDVKLADDGIVLRHENARG